MSALFKHRKGAQPSRFESSGDNAEQWAAEAATHLRFVKNAWRNQAMHRHNSYDEERCIQIYDNTQSFMRHLATKVSEHDLKI